MLLYVEMLFRSLVGKEIDVLIDGISEDGQLIGRTQWDAPDIDPVVFVGPPEDDSIPMPQVRNAVCR